MLKGAVAREVVIESVFDIGAYRDLRAGKKFLHRFGENMRGVVADQFQRLGRFARDDFHFRVMFDHARQIAQFAVELDRERGLGEAGADRGGEIQTRYGTGKFFDGSVGQSEAKRHVGGSERLFHTVFLANVSLSCNAVEK